MKSPPETTPAAADRPLTDPAARGADTAARQAASQTVGQPGSKDSGTADPAVPPSEPCQPDNRPGASLSRWWRSFTRPGPHPGRVVFGAALAALVGGALLLGLSLVQRGWKETMGLFPEPVTDFAVRLDAFGPHAVPPPWRRHVMIVPDAYTLASTGTWRGGTETIVRAPVRPGALPYSEAPLAPLAEAVKQVDYALTQAVNRLDPESRFLHLISIERRQAAPSSETYLFQRLRLYVSGNEAADPERDLAGQLAGTVSIWCDRAAVETSGHRLYVTVDGVPTHEVYLSVWNGETLAELPDHIPRLTIVIDDLGASPQAARELLSLGLPLTFSVWPRAAFAGQVARSAWEQGHEVLIHQPCEPRDYPAVNPGPGAVFVAMPPEQIAAVFRENAARLPQAVGFNNHMGSRFTADPAASRALCAAAAEAGLFALDSLTHVDSRLGDSAAGMGLTAYERSVFLDDPRSPAAIRAALRAAERLARANGQAIAIGHPYPETIAALRAWSRERDPAIQLVPLRLQRPRAPR